MKALLRLLVVILPWPLRRRILIRFFGYELDPSSRIGLAWVFPRQLVMGPHSRIGTLTICKNLERIHLQPYATIGRGNWITGFPLSSSEFFAEEKARLPELRMGEHSAVTNRHLIDCTNLVTIGRFTTFAGFQSQVLSHSIDIEHNRQASAPVEIGDYCFIGTNCVLLGGCRLPDYSVLGAKSLLTKRFCDTYSLYGGVPATRIKALSTDSKYFRRTKGLVN